MRALALCVLLGASSVFACAVCGAGEDDPSRGSYVWMSLIISFLPLVMLGGLVAFVVHKTRAQARLDAATSAEPAKS